MNQQPTRRTLGKTLLTLLGAGVIATPNANAAACTVIGDTMTTASAKNLRTQTANDNTSNWGYRQLILPLDCDTVRIDTYTERGPLPEHCLSTIFRIDEDGRYQVGTMFRDDNASYLIPTDDQSVDQRAVYLLELYAPGTIKPRINNLASNATSGKRVQYGPLNESIWGGLPACSGGDNPWENEMGLSAKEWLWYQQNIPMLRQLVSGISNPWSTAILTPEGIQSDGRFYFNVDVYKQQNHDRDPTQDFSTPYVFGANFSMNPNGQDNVVLTRNNKPTQLAGAYGQVAIGEPHDPNLGDAQCKVDVNYAGPSTVDYSKIVSLMGGLNTNYQ